MKNIIKAWALMFLLSGCGEFDEDKRVYELADQCYELSHQNQSLNYHSAHHYELRFSASTSQSLPLFVTATDLGKYLIYIDQDQRYLAAGPVDWLSGFQVNHLSYPQQLFSEVKDITSSEEQFRLSEAEWWFEQTDHNSVLLYNPATQKWLAQRSQHNTQLGLAGKNYALELTLTATDPANCSQFPESQLNAELINSELQTHWPNGDLWGMADAHEHIFHYISTHGSLIAGHAFHPLGIEHALHDCSKHHGPGGSHDILSSEAVLSGDLNVGDVLLTALFRQEKYKTDGYPSFTNWPSADWWAHQALYYKWIERAYLGGLRLMTEYAVSQQILCEASNVVYTGLLAFDKISQRSCNEMDGVDRMLERVEHMQRYIDAKHGGEGKGWFRIVYSPEQAREVIAQGKMAVVLGLEIENPFNCFAGTNSKNSECDPVQLEADLDEYYDRGIRAIFPVHKFTNGFASSDGQYGLLEVFEVIHNKHARDYIACDRIDAPVPGRYEFGGSDGVSLLTEESESYAGYQQAYTWLQTNLPGVHEFLSGFIGINSDNNSLRIPYLYDESGHCQREGLSELGESFLTMLMERGMIVDASHFSTQGLVDAYRIFEQYNYAPVQTHGGNYNEKLLELGGVQKTNFYQNCQRSEASRPLMGDNIENYLFDHNQISQRPEFYQALVLGFDLNGLAPYVRPRFGPGSHCEETQHTQVEYPFDSFAGDVRFEPLTTGDRMFNVNTDGMANIGLLPDVIQDHRNNGVTDEELSPLFRGAEGYIRMWEHNLQIAGSL